MTPQELKASILQLAVQGKLVEQRTEEGTGEELYQQIQSEKQRLIETGKIKKAKRLPEIAEDDIPFEIPETWSWTRLSELGQLRNGYAFKSAEYVTSGIQVVRISDLGDDCVESKDAVFYPYKDELYPYVIEDGSFLICMTGSIGKMAWVRDGVVRYLNQRVGMFIPNKRCDPAYLWFFLHTSQVINGWIRAKTSTNGNIKTSDITDLVVPIPPFAEQKRIVAKIEELLPYIDRYEQAWSKLEDFNKRFPADMQKSILQMAIQGKLVEQRPEEGTGEELYRQIQAEKQALIKAGKIKKEKPLPVIAEDEIPFDIPESWKWVRLIDLCKSISDGDHQPPPQVPNGIPFLVISNVSSGTIDFSNTRYVPRDYFESLSEDRVAEDGDILFTVTGSYGIPVKVNCNEQFCFQRHIALLKLLIEWDYLFYVLKSPVIKSQCDATATGTAQKTVGLKSLRNMLLPLPPLAEQKRVVAKLEEILPLCERLK